MTPTLHDRPGSAFGLSRGFSRLLETVPRLGRSLRAARWPALALAGAGSLLVLLLWLGEPRDVPRPSPVPPPGPAVSGTARTSGGLRTATAPESEPIQAADLARWRPAAPPLASDVAAPWGRRIIRQATLDIQLDDVDQAVARLTEVVEAAGGYVADTQVHSDGQGTTRATITAYVPPAAFGPTLRDVERVGRPTARRVTGQDVSEEFVDLEARVRNLERHEAQLLDFMGKAQKVADLVSLESEVARVRGEIERLTGRIRFLRARAEMASIQVSLVRGGAPASTDDRLARAWERVRLAFVAGWKAAFDVAVGLAAVAAQVSPLALMALVGWGLYRRFRRQPAVPPPAVTS